MKIFMIKISLVFFLIWLDQFSKYFITQQHLPYSCNPYISWGIPLGGWLLIFFIFLALILLFYVAKNFSYHYSILFIIAGALGNLIDRFKIQCVIDFISLSIFPLVNKISFLANFPTFNLADVFITFGVIIFFYQEFKK